MSGVVTDKSESYISLIRRNIPPEASRKPLMMPIVSVDIFGNKGHSSRMLVITGVTQATPRSCQPAQIKYGLDS